MRTLLKVFAAAVVVLVVIVVAMYALGAALPVAHISSASALINAPQARVWNLIQDTSSQPSWRTGLKAVEPLPDKNNQHCWMELQQIGKMPLCEHMVAAPAVRIVSIDDPSLPFGGSWTYELQPESPNTTRVTIIENGTTRPPMWRFLGHYVFHEDTTIKQYLEDLQKVAGRTTA